MGVSACVVAQRSIGARDEGPLGEREPPGMLTDINSQARIGIQDRQLGKETSPAQDNYQESDSRTSFPFLHPVSYNIASSEGIFEEEITLWYSSPQMLQKIQSSRFIPADDKQRVY